MSAGWQLVAVFNSADEDERDGRCDRAPGSDAREFSNIVRELWDGHHGVPGNVVRRGAVVTLTAGVIDVLAEPWRWLVMNTVPKKVTLTRHDDDEE